MKQQIVIYVIIGVIGLGAGLGVGVLITKSKVTREKAIVAELDSKLQTAQRAQMMAQQRAQNADTEIIRLNGELVKAKTDLEGKSPESGQNNLSTGLGTAAKNTAGSGSDANQTAAAGTYVVKEGDSLWKIAASQLGDANRYKDIIKLNPSVSSNKNLHVGMKLKMPAK